MRSYLIQYIADMSTVCPEDPELGAWYLSPNHHLTEFIIVNIIGLAVFYYCYRKYKLQQQQQQSNNVNNTTNNPNNLLFNNPNTIILIDQFLLLILLASFLLVCYHKYSESRLWFLLQPCHVLHLLLSYIVYLHINSTRNNNNNSNNSNNGSNSGNNGEYLFNLYLHLFFSPVLGLIAADLSCYTQRFELFNWCLQHLLLILIPLYYIVIQAYRLLSGPIVFFMYFTIETLYHSAVLQFIAIITGYNLNYILCPPTGILTELFSIYYRITMYLFCMGLSFIIRYGLIEGIIYCCINKNKNKGKRSNNRITDNSNTVQSINTDNNSTSSNVSNNNNVIKKRTSSRRAE